MLQFAKRLGVSFLIAIFSFFPYGEYLFSELSFSSTPKAKAQVGTVAPGGVGGDIKLWLRADAGVTGGVSVSTWADQSGNNNNLTQSNLNNQPNGTTNRLNFNPVVTFDGSNDRLINSALNVNLNTGSGPRELFSVTQYDAAPSNRGTVLYMGGNGAVNNQNITYGLLDSVSGTGGLSVFTSGTNNTFSTEWYSPLNGLKSEAIIGRYSSTNNATDS